MAICDNMRAIRKKKNLTQKQVADACGLSDSTIRTYELGKANPKPATIAKIAKALSVSAAELYGVDWMPGIETSDQETNSALYQSIFTERGDTLPIDSPNKARLLVAFDHLNPNGQIESIKRMEELAQIPAYQATWIDFTSEEVNNLKSACHSINNAQLELDLMEKRGSTTGPAVQPSEQMITNAKKRIVDIISKRMEELTQTPTYQTPGTGFTAREMETLELIYKISNEIQSELDLMEKRGETTSVAVQTNKRALEKLEKKIVSIVLKRMEQLTQTPTQQAVKIDFTSEEVNKLVSAYHSINKARLGMDLIEKIGTITDDTVESNEQLIVNAEQEIVNIILKQELPSSDPK